MKQIFTLVIALFAISSSFAQVTAVKNGKWDEKGTWNTNNLPPSGSEVIIPNGIAVQVDDNAKFTNVDFTVQVFGILSLNQGKLNIGGNSVINVYPSGRIVPVKGNGGEKITIGNIEQYTGKEGIIYGPMVATKTTNGFVPFTFSVLPVQFASFGVALQNGKVLVQWSTIQEDGASYFEVERSTNGTDWTGIGQVTATGNSTRLVQYAFTDRNLVNGTAYYRIKQADVTGKTAYTAVQAIRTAAAQVSIMNFHNKVAVQFGKEVKGKVDVLVVNRAGQVVARQTLTNPVGNVVLNTSSLKGNHFVTIQSIAGVSASQQVVL
ncbi:MAG: hypothetical protein ACO1NX_09765 [Chitinophagaceae bacterium]